MAYDLETLRRAQEENGPPVLRFFRWNQPTVSYGRHQRFIDIHSFVPAGWEVVQRPTGGGLVYHKDDLCVSLCWRQGQPPFPTRLRDVYAWIHSLLLEAIQPFTKARLATCKDCKKDQVPFATQQCFNQPVAYDILKGVQKVVGGALCRQKGALLYQGSIQNIPRTDIASSIVNAFRRAFRRTWAN